MAKLGVNIDHVATIRQARGTFEPDPVRAAVICEIAGADSIVAHLREDRRHTRERDLQMIKAMLNIGLNFEMCASPEIVEIGLKLVPEQVTIVPEKRQELTTESGLAVRAQVPKLEVIVGKFVSKGVKVSLFVDPVEDEISAAVDTGAEAVEIHTGMYAEAFLSGDFRDELANLAAAVEFGKKANLNVHAGHGLTYQNAGMVAEINGIEELNIGHTIIARAVLVGLERAVKDMIALVRK